MTLGFVTKIGNKPTLFVEKIWKGIEDHEITKELCDATFKYGFNWDKYGSINAKIHTIRADTPNRWKVGNKIHFAINNQTKDRFQFAPILLVKHTQDFEIKYLVLKERTVVSIYVDQILQGEIILVNCAVKSSSSTVDKIALNDGFDSINDFLEWFDSDFKGKLIHWTDFKY